MKTAYPLFPRVETQNLSLSTRFFTGLPHQPFPFTPSFPFLDLRKLRVTKEDSPSILVSIYVVLSTLGQKGAQQCPAQDSF